MMSDSITIRGWIYRSRQNGVVVDAGGVAPTLSVGKHSGVEPRVLWYDET